MLTTIRVLVAAGALFVVAMFACAEMRSAYERNVRKFGMRPACKHCEFLREMKGGFYCVRFPPSVVQSVSRTSKDKFEVSTRSWPRVELVDRCGEFEPVMTEKDKGDTQ